MALKMIFPSRKDKEVQAGDFLGRVDSQIMDHFVQKGFFRNQSEYNYQALCPTQIDCKTENAAPKVVVFNLIHGLVNILKDLSVLMYALTGLFPGMYLNFRAFFSFFLICQNLPQSAADFYKNSPNYENKTWTIFFVFARNGLCWHQ